LAAFSAWQATGATAFDDQIVLAGFSLGEYAALGAARVLDLESLMNLLQKRSEYMQAACEQTDGAMYAILGLQDEQVEAVCAQSEFKNKVFPANYNCPGQLVISGHAEPTASAAEACKEAGAKRAVQLQVAGAFHTPLMNAAAEQLAAYASALPFQTAALPVYSNFTAAPVPADVDPAAYLATHMISPVRWTSEVQQIIADGHTSFIEFGPGKVLSGLIRKIDRSVKVGRVEDMATLAAAATD
jgi:[acyl-carrier-protein] S-malonyltransferase